MKPFVYQEKYFAKHPVARIQSERVIRELVNGLLVGKYYSVMGPPFSGKTSLIVDVLRTLEQIEPRCIPVYINFRDLNHLSRSDLCEEITLQLSELSNAKPIPRGTTCEFSQLHHLLLKVVEGKSNRLVLALDHIEDLLLETQTALVHLSRSLYGQREVNGEFGKISVLLSGSINLYTLPIGPASPYNISQLYWMEDLDPDEVFELVHRGESLSNKIFSDDAIQLIIAATSGDRYFIQRICALCLEHPDLDQRNLVTLQVAADSIERVKQFNAEDDPCLRQLVEKLYHLDEPELIDAFQSLISNPPQMVPLSQFSMEQARLLGVITPVGGSYQIRNSIYRAYLDRHAFYIEQGFRVYQRQIRKEARLLRFQQIVFDVVSTFDLDKALEDGILRLSKTLEAVGVTLFSYNHSDNRCTVLASSHRLSWKTGDRLPPPPGAQDAIDQMKYNVCHTGENRCQLEGCKYRSQLSYCICIWLPLVIGQRVIGLLEIVSNEDLDLDVELPALQILAAHLATSLANSQFVRLLNAIGAISFTTWRDDLSLSKIVTEAKNLLGAPVVNLWSYDSQIRRFHIIETEGLDKEGVARLEWRLDEPMISETIERKTPLLLKSIGVSPLFNEKNRKIYAELGLQSILLMPLCVDDAPVGILEVATRNEWEPTQWEKDVVRILGNQVAGAIANASAVKELTEISDEREFYIEVLRHEISSGPGIAIGHVQNLLDGKLGSLNAEQEDRLLRVLKDLNTHDRLIEKLRLMGRLKAGKVQIQKKETDIVRLIKGVIANCKDKIQEKGINFYPSVRVQVQNVVVDPNWVETIVLNLLENAIKYTPEGGSIILRVHSTRRSLSVTVDDTGIGIARGEENRIFREYYQIAPNTPEGKKGVGSGLYIAKTLAKMHHGDVRFIPKNDKGSIFQLEIPLSSLEEAE